MTTPRDAVEPPIVVRPLEDTDIDGAVEMFAAVAEEGRWLGTEAGFDRDERRRSWRRGLDDPLKRSYVAVTEQGAIVGNASLHLASYGVAELAMAVAAAWRGRGVGGRLLDALVVGAGELCAHKVALQVWPHNTSAIGLYRSRGFVEEGRLHRHYRRSSGELWDAVVMGLQLDEPARRLSG